MSTYIKLSKTQISKRIQSSGSFSSWLVNLGKKALRKVAIHLARNNLPALVNNLASNSIHRLEGKISGEGAVSAGKVFISNVDINNIIKTINSSEDSDVLIDDITKTVKHWIKK